MIPPPSTETVFIYPVCLVCQTKVKIERPINRRYIGDEFVCNDCKEDAYNEAQSYGGTGDDIARRYPQILYRKRQSAHKLQQDIKGVQSSYGTSRRT